MSGFLLDKRQEDALPAGTADAAVPAVRLFGDDAAAEILQSALRNGRIAALVGGRVARHREVFCSEYP